MICCDHMVFVHVMKTGGKWVRDALSGGIPPEWNVYDSLRPTPTDQAAGLHTGILDAPSEYRGAPVLAYVRNPWDWYVSYFSFFRNKFDAGEDVGVFRRSLASLLEQNTCTMHSVGMVLGEEGVVCCRMRRVEDGVGAQLLRFMDDNCPYVPEAVRVAVNSMERKNVSRRGDYRSYYTDEMAASVAIRDAWLISEYDYEFGG